MSLNILFLASATTLLLSCYTNDKFTINNKTSTPIHAGTTAYFVHPSKHILVLYPGFFVFAVISLARQSLQKELRIQAYTSENTIQETYKEAVIKATIICK